MKRHKKRKIKFVRALCNECGKDQILFMHSTTKVKCFDCNKTITMPSGGKCKLTGCKKVEDLE